MPREIQKEREKVFLLVYALKMKKGLMMEREMDGQRGAVWVCTLD